MDVSKERGSAAKAHGGVAAQAYLGCGLHEPSIRQRMGSSAHTCLQGAPGLLWNGMQGPKRKSPLSILGKRLRLIRERRQESLAEVSGAVEIEIDMLERIEQGTEQPSEDILMLLINYFGLHEQEASQLWEWAGYGQNAGSKHNLADASAKAALVVVALDARAIYSDGVILAANDSGVILNFMQSTGQGQPQPVARIGMSHQQAEALTKLLQQSNLRVKYLPKQQLLPPGETA